MAITQEQIDAFHSFATEKLKSGENLSWPSLFDLWRVENPSADQQAAIYGALDESLDDLQNGRHRPAKEVLRELREKHNLQGS